MRLIAALCTLPALAAAAWSAHLLWQELAPSGTGAAAAAAQAFAAASGAEPPPPPAAAPRPDRRWPPLFGEPQPPRSAAPAPAAPQPPLPPLASLGYSLRGVVQSDGAAWAVLAHPAGAQMVRAGDRLEGAAEVVGVGAEGVWLSRRGGAPELLGFAD